MPVLGLKLCCISLLPAYSMVMVEVLLGIMRGVEKVSDTQA